jgi:FkbM family methyltransferase
MNTHPAFARFRLWEGNVDPGWVVNWIGVRTRVAVQSDHAGFPTPTHVKPELPPLSEEYFEWIDVLESVAESSGPFTMVELGAGWGRWLVNAAFALEQLAPGRPLRLVGVEAEPTHFSWLASHLRDNGIDPEGHTLVRAAVAERDGRLRFQRGDAARWYGQSIERDDPASKLAGPVSRLIRWTRNTVANRLAVGPDARKVRRTRAVALSTILEPLDRVDLIDADIQGAEAGVFESAEAELSRKVRRVHIGTHDRDNELRLRALFTRIGWDCRFDYESRSEVATPWGQCVFEDGIQSWINPALPPRG